MDQLFVSVVFISGFCKEYVVESAISKKHVRQQNNLQKTQFIKQLKQLLQNANIKTHEIAFPTKLRSRNSIENAILYQNPM